VFIDKSADKQNEHFKHGINQWTGEPNKPVFYSKEMAQKIRDLHKPAPGLQMDISRRPEFLTIVLYEDNFKQYDGSLKMRIIDYVEMVKKIIESYGVRCELEGRPGERISR
jgi:hypothetical protein